MGGNVRDTLEREQIMMSSHHLATFAIVMAATVFADIPPTMRAAVATGSAPAGDFSQIQTLKTPSPGLFEVLIAVNASGVNPVDWKQTESGFEIPAFYPRTLGFDTAGTVVKLGFGCSRLKLGDRVWADLGKLKILKDKGMQLGAFAEYALADESQVGLMPSSMSFEEAGSMPLVALTDIQALRKAGAPWKVPAGGEFRVAITSGSGGTGFAAIQIAKALGATYVAAAASSKHAELLKSLGADLVVDYHDSTLWAALKNNSIDVVYDNYGAPGTADAAMASLKQGGSFVFLPGKGGKLSKNPKEGVKQINYGLCDASKHEDLDAIKQMVDAKQLRAVVQQTFTLEQIREAYNMSYSGHVVGKLSIII